MTDVNLITLRKGHSFAIGSEDSGDYVKIVVLGIQGRKAQLGLDEYTAPTGNITMSGKTRIVYREQGATVFFKKGGSLQLINVWEEHVRMAVNWPQLIG